MPSLKEISLNYFVASIHCFVRSLIVTVLSYFLDCNGNLDLTVQVFQHRYLGPSEIPFDIQVLH